MKNVFVLLAAGTLAFAACSPRPTEDAVSTPIEVPVEGSVTAPTDGTATNLDTIPRDNTDVATTSGTATPPSR